MPRITVSGDFSISTDQLFDFISNPENHTNIPDILSINLLTPQPSKKGTRWQETRIMNNEQVTMEFYISEWNPGRAFTITSDTGGIKWETEHRTEPGLMGSVLTLDCRWEANGLMMKLTAPLVKSSIKKSLKKDITSMQKLLNK